MIIRSFEYDIGNDDVWYVKFQVDPKQNHLIIGRENKKVGKGVFGLNVFPVSNPQTETEQITEETIIPSHLNGLIRSISFSEDSKYMIASSDNGYLSIFTEKIQKL